MNTEDLLEALIPLLSVVGLFGSLFAWIWLYFRGRHRERMAMIERGIGASGLDTGSGTALRAALLLVGVGVGIALGFLVARRGVPGWVAYTASLASCIGLALLCSVWWDRRSRPADPGAAQGERRLAAGAADRQA